MLAQRALPPFACFNQHINISSQNGQRCSPLRILTSDLPDSFLLIPFDRLALTARLNSWNFFNCNEHASRGGRLRAVPTKIKDFEVSPSAQDLQHRFIPALHLIVQPLRRSNTQSCETPPSFAVSPHKKGSPFTPFALL